MISFTNIQKSLMLAFATIFILGSCESLDLKTDAPSCIESKIRKIKNEGVRNPPAQVWKWEVDGKTY